MTETPRDSGLHQLLGDVPENCKADFRVCSSGSNVWQVTMLSERARRWAHQNVNSDCYDVAQADLMTDLEGVNSLLHRARLAGFAAVYVGPLENVRF